MSLLNYTTKVDVERTIGEIQRQLSKHGAQSIMTDYEEGYVKALSFLLVIDGKKIGFRLPTDWKPVLEILDNDPQAHRRGVVNQEQAVRVAWRIIKDWVEAQMALIDTNMVKIQTVFLPYAMTKSGLTLAEKFEKDGGNFLLGDGKQST